MKLVCETEATAVCTVLEMVEETPLLTRISHLRRQEEVKANKHFSGAIMTVDNIDVVVSKKDEGFFNRLLNGWGFF